MKKQFALLAFIAVIFLLSSCAKEKNNAPVVKTKTQLLSQSPWLFQSAAAGGTDISNAAQLLCFKDNIITFTNTNTGTIAEGALVCSPSTAGPFTWNFTTGETILVLSAPLFPGGSSTFNIVSISETNMVLSQDVNFPPLTLVTITFKH